MRKVKEPANQRQYNRFRADGLALATVNATIQFHIIDISDNGLAFRYIGKEKWFNNPTELDIFYGTDFCLKRFPVTSISDFSFANGFMPMRRHSVKFGKLKSYQKTQLYQFISYYTQEKM